ncbi:oxidoreductase, short chain dehydrogenase/reductase family protein [Ostertagia ostertagi]
MVTGANRGIGLGLVKEFLKNKEISHVIATARDPDSANGDKRSSAEHREVERDLRRLHQEQLTRSNQEPNRADIIRNFDVNAASVAVLTQTFLPLLRKAASQVESEEFSPDRAAILNISSGVASISTNTSGSGKFGSLAYRMSKSALNALMKTMSIDLESEHILIVSFCPGWVKTDMGGTECDYYG